MYQGSAPPNYNDSRAFPSTGGQFNTSYQASNFNISSDPVLTQVGAQQNREARLRQIVQRYEISDKFTNKLQMLHGFKIVYIFDDSGSMNTPLEDSPLNSTGNLMKARRWDELQYYSTISLEIATLFNSGGCDVYFLNRGIVRNVRSHLDLQSYFQNPPQGFTPLKDTFNLVISDNYEAARERKLLVIMITDGEPTDRSGVKSEINEFRKCLAERNPINNIYVTIVACTDDDNSMAYLDKWDRQIRNLDVVDDYRNERDQIRKAQGNQFPFSYGDYAVKSLIGSIDPELDNLDESGSCCTIL